MKEGNLSKTRHIQARISQRAINRPPLMNKGMLVVVKEDGVLITTYWLDSYDRGLGE
jgi:hypothetical protein